MHRSSGKAGEEEAGFNMDLSDPRFSELFQDHTFALDPTDPRCDIVREAVIYR